MIKIILHSTTKRSEILHQAKELQLTGILKHGFPGIVIVEGELQNVLEYVRRIQRLRWQQMSVRGEEIDVIKCNVMSTKGHHIIRNGGDGGVDDGNCPAGKYYYHIDDDEDDYNNAESSNYSRDGHHVRAFSVNENKRSICNRSNSRSRSNDTKRRGYSSEDQIINHHRKITTMTMYEIDGGMSDVSSFCKTMGIHELFMTALKYKATTTTTA